MKIFIVLFLFLFSVHQTPVSAMMLSPLGQQLAEDMKEVNCLRAQKRTNEQVCITVPNIYEKINNNWIYVLPHKEMSVDSPYWEAKRITADALFLGKKQKAQAPTLILKTSPEHIIVALEDLINLSFG